MDLFTANQNHQTNFQLPDEYSCIGLYIVLGHSFTFSLIPLFKMMMSDEQEMRTGCNTFQGIEGKTYQAETSTAKQYQHLILFLENDE